MRDGVVMVAAILGIAMLVLAGAFSERSVSDAVTKYFRMGLPERSKPHVFTKPFEEEERAIAEEQRQKYMAQQGEEIAQRGSITSNSVQTWSGPEPAAAPPTARKTSRFFGWLRRL